MMAIAFTVLDRKYPYWTNLFLRGNYFEGSISAEPLVSNKWIKMLWECQEIKWLKTYLTIKSESK